MRRTRLLKACWGCHSEAGHICSAPCQQSFGMGNGTGQHPPATHILGPRTLHPAPETCVFCYAKTGEKIFLWPSEHFWPVLSLSPHKYTPWSAHCALQEAQKPWGARSQALPQGAASPSCPSSQPSSCRLAKEILFWLEER